LDAQSTLADPRTPLDFITAWFLIKGVPVNARGELEFLSRRDNKSHLLDCLFLDYMDAYRERRLQVRAHNENLPRKAEKLPAPVGFSQAELNAAFNTYINNQAAAAFERLKSTIAYQPKVEAEGHIEHVLNILMKDPTPLDITVFKHLLWQVKQRMWNRPARHEMIVSVYGKQGAGKTTFVRQLGQPIKDLFVERSMREIVGDERNNFMLQKAYLLLFEELENASRVDIDSLKAITSKDRTNWRMLGKNQDDNGFNNTTFICTSNKPIRQVFYDTTGMRRFYEFTVQDEIPRRQINSVDFTKLWQSVNEAGSCPVEDCIKELYAHQNKVYRQQGTVEAFLDDAGFIKSEEDHTILKKLYEEYKSFCDQAGIKSPLARNNFSNELVNMGFEKKRMGQGMAFNLSRSTPTPNKVLKLPSVK
jgi:energy-coupling factor transporter ATP-binding protein EcfA2